MQCNGDVVHVGFFDNVKYDSGVVHDNDVRYGNDCARVNNNALHGLNKE